MTGRVDIIASQIMKVNINTATNEMVEPKDEIIFHVV